MHRPPFLTAPQAHTRTPRTGSLTYRDLHGERVTIRRPSTLARAGTTALWLAWHGLAIVGMVLLAVRVFP
jgi:hypothetical protein